MENSTFIKSTLFTSFAIFTLPIIIHASKISLTLSTVLSIISIIWFGYLAGLILVKICKLLPALLIQLIIGLVFRSFLKPILLENLSESYSENYDNSFKSISGILKDTAMAVLVMRAGLGFDLSALKRVAKSCLMLTVLPCLTEILVCASLAQFILNWEMGGFNGIVFGCMMGCVLKR